LCNIYLKKKPTEDNNDHILYLFCLSNFEIEET